MANRFSGMDSNQEPQFRNDTQSSSRFNRLNDLMNVGPLTEQALDDITKEQREIYPTVVDENTRPQNEQPEVTNTYNSANIGYTGPGAVQTQVAGDVGRTQSLYNEQLMQRLYPDEAGIDPEQDTPPLDPQEEIYYLKEFARLKGVSTLEVERQPALREEFGRYLGQKTMTMDSNRYYGYTPEGESYRGQNDGRVPTMYRMPTQISNHNRQAYPETTSSPDLPNAMLARGDRGKIVQNLVDYGMLREHAEERYDAAMLLNPEESIIAQSMGSVAAASTTDQAKQSLQYFEDGMNGMSNKIHSSLQKTLRQGAMGPQALERFTKKILEGDPNFSRTNAKEFMYSFIASYGSVAELNPQAGRAWADFMLLAVLNHSRTKMHSYNRKRNDPNTDQVVQQETMEQARERNERSLMVGISDDREIGTVILKEMGFEKATGEQQAIAGAIAKSLVVDAFADVDANSQDENFGMWNEQMFEKVEAYETNPDGSLILDEQGMSKKQKSFTLSARGLEVAERLMPMFNEVMPSSVKRVRTTRKRTRQGVGPRKTNNTLDIFGNEVQQGDLTEMDEMKNQAENTATTISVTMAPVITEIAAEMQGLLKKYAGNLESPQYLAEYQETMMYAIQHPKYQNMKGDGTGDMGTYGRRSGKILSRDRAGNYLKKNEMGVDEIVESDFADELDDYSDRIKDAEFDSAVVFMQEHLGKEFFYDYFYGLNTRLSVDQSIGNYQHSKLIRSAIESHQKFSYEFNNPMHVISLKAGIMKRFGYDKMDVLTAADQFDIEIGAWANTDTKQKIEIGKSHEGWASVAAIAEAVAFYTKLQSPSSVEHTTGFYTEVDGLTNGMAHSASQAGDMDTGWGAGLFDPIHYDHWVRNYDMMEKLTREGDIDAFLALEQAEGNTIQMEVFLDAYNRVNETMKDNIRRLWNGSKRGQSGVSPDTLGLPGLVMDSANVAATTIMELAHGGGDGKGKGSRKFMDAIRLMNKVDKDGKPTSKLGRSFVKKPVMIFGYGAGAARIGEAVRMFVDDLFLRDPDLRQQFIENGIDIDKEFIDPLGVIASEAVTQSFGKIKDFATTLSKVASVASEQEFALNIPTLAGYKINLGGKVFKVDEGKRTRFQYFPGVQSLRTDAARFADPMDAEYNLKNIPDGKGGYTNRFQGSSQMMMAEWDPFFAVNNYLKAATQITVMMNHANDNINMQRHLVNIHRRKLAKKNIKYDATVTDAGNTALHIFDGLLVMPYEAAMHTKELNRVFKDMAIGKTKSGNYRGHTSFVIDALTYELMPNGDRIDDKRANIGTRPKDYKVGAVEFDTSKVRLLNPVGVELANSEQWGTWHPLLDKYAMQWKGEAAKALEELKYFDSQRQSMAGKVSNYHQFFWSTRENVQDLLDSQPERTQRHVKARRTIQ